MRTIVIKLREPLLGELPDDEANETQQRNTTCYTETYVCAFAWP
jgi:hypothetical protein